ncbi:hypothetical protein BDE36_1724 [Arcticibacter tournemirensis]|uniref:Uncharacterized protein n=1 Tax=Arcticibacter tournemirensis TaxID=699437 RepID=A0A4Q0M919_9SPHI|nr:hypothetical protein [Arcticibacter tournemirensis]KAA8483804.1 hypothetical protein F1649_07925 [Arcticibacter tournemirensis]RXF69657.1 hypothetical protein EKH83_10370 [Arcticibacter tournemirensis]TQM49990.1 hypothetical protein BDE36_1724 [Arcticibacter tournemirensis]
MEATQHLRNLGDEVIRVESLYLSLKIGKALAGERFLKEKELSEAEELWKDINKEYYSFLAFLQSRDGIAA